ncbi:hypothetical protein [Leucobacter allii]|nr:hypothetical protein [Leucobacter allii]
MTSYLSPLPLVPDDVEAASEVEKTGGWLRRPGRRIRKEKRR